MFLINMFFITILTFCTFILINLVIVQTIYNMVLLLTIVLKY